MNCFQIAEVRQIPELRVGSLDIQIPGDLLHRGEHLQSLGIQRYVAWSHRVVGVDILEAREGLIQNANIAIDHRTIPERVNIAGMQDSNARAGFGARSIAGHTLAPLVHLVLGTAAHAGAIITQQMTGTLFDAGGTIGILSLRIRFKNIGGGIVLAHGRAFLLAYALVEEVLAGDAILLRGTSASSGAEEVTTLPRLWSIATTSGTLWRAGELAELLAILGTLAPTSVRAALVALGTLALRSSKVVVVVCIRAVGYNLRPLDRSHVAEIVVVVEAHLAI